MSDNNSRADIVQSTVAVFCIGLLLGASFWIIRPFLTPLIWAAMIVITTWPWLLSLEQRCGGRRWPALALLTTALVLLLIVPLGYGIFTAIDRADEIVLWSKSLTAYEIPPPPEWVGRLPLVGAKAAAGWQQFAAAGKVELAGRLSPYLTRIVRWLLEQAGSAVMMSVQFLLTVVICAVLYAGGERAAAGICRFARRLGGRQGEEAALLAARAVRGVALGVVVTALVQAILGAIGLVLAGIPAVALLTAAMFVLCVAQVGPLPVFLPVIAWLFWSGQTLAGALLTGWALVVVTLDNFLRPALIKKGADLPLLLIFAGVLGGLAAFGVLGLFIGPVVLAVTYTLVASWVNGGESVPGESAASGAADPASGTDRAA